MKTPAELLASNVNEDRVFARRKLVHAFRPEWNREAEQQNGLDQNHAKFQMRGDAAFNTGVICDGTTAFPATNQNENEESRQADKKCAHEAMGKLEQSHVSKAI